MTAMPQNVNVKLWLDSSVDKSYVCISFLFFLFNQNAISIILGTYFPREVKGVLFLQNNHPLFFSSKWIISLLWWINAWELASSCCERGCQSCGKCHSCVSSPLVEYAKALWYTLDKLVCIATIKCEKQSLHGAKINKLRGSADILHRGLWGATRGRTSSFKCTSSESHRSH